MQGKYLEFIVMFTILLSGCVGQGDSVVSGPFLGQKPPGVTPEVFAPGLVSTGYQERNIAFSPDGKELYYCLYGAPHGVFLFMREVNGRWTKPQVAPFSGRYPGELAMSPDGNTIVFSSNQPFENSPDTNEYWGWKVERDGPGWRLPEPLGRMVNSEGFTGYPSMSGNRNLYFYSERVGGKGVDDIYVSQWVDGRYTEAQNLGDSINSHVKEVDPFISPDESFLIFCRMEEAAGWDLFVSFRKDDGSWTVAVNLGDRINSDASDFCPSLSPDGKYLFFTSTRSHHRSFSDVPITYEDKLRIMNGPGNGNSDIYWVDAKIIQELKLNSLR